MTFNDVENLLGARLGFDIQSVGPQAIEAVVRQCMDEAGFSDPSAYARMLSIDPDAWNCLVDKVMIPETWFFRDIAPFELAANLARTHMSRTPGKVLRILSCPCSTGEEPYSLSMAILHAGAPPESFTVDAVDVSRKALEYAKAAVFRSRSFRENATWFRAPFFDHIEGSGMWHLKADVVSQVRFRHANLTWPDFLEDDEPYDLVFCRNLLIYLHTEARLLAITNLRRLLAEKGVLVLGHAETAFAREHGFTPTGPPAAFAVVKDGAGITPKPYSTRRRDVASGVPQRAPVVSPRAGANVPVALPLASSDASAISVAASNQEPDDSLLINARQLGDTGQLHEALRVCGEHLHRVPDSAEGYFLLGVLHDALGHVDLAVRYFRRVLYLDPNHREGLLHLALKQEAAGDSAGAALLRARARRAENVGQSSKP